MIKKRLTFTVQLSLSGEPLGTDALVRSRDVNASSVYPTGSQASALIDVETFFLTRPGKSLGTQTGVTTITVDALCRFSARVRLALVNI